MEKTSKDVVTNGGNLMDYNNIYNFKNPVKHFININNLTFPTAPASISIESTCWTKPFKFRIQKNSNSFRTLKMPNIIALTCAYEHLKTLPHFDDPQQLDIKHKRLSARLNTGDFAVGEYDIHLENDFNALCVYDNLIKLDITEFYGRIYTHYLDFNGLTDRYITNMNFGATNGLIMGNYLSLYFAEQYLVKISQEIENSLSAQGITCEYTYFSDDFYFFCNKNDNAKIIQIFDSTLDKFDLDRNGAKFELWDYEKFNSYNVIARYWKKLIAHCNTHYSSTSNNNKLVFINQIIYRISQLYDDKQKKVFINNFFKTKYFRTLDLENFITKYYDYHQLCHIFRTSPESLLYCIDKFSRMTNFDKGQIHKFFKIRYGESLKTPYHDEQLYFFYAIQLLEFHDILSDSKDLVLKSDNQILISYYLKDNILSEQDINILKTITDESYWFQSYHLILYSSDLLSDIDNSIMTYLIPKKCLPTANESSTNCNRRQTYMEFYKENLTLGNALIQDIEDVEMTIHEYLDLRFEEEENLYYSF